MKRFHHLILVVVLLLFIAGAEASDKYTQLQYLTNLDMKEGDSKILIQACNNSKNINNCVKFGGAIRAQEGGYGTRHPFGMLSQPSWYKGKRKEKVTSEYVELWVGSFDKHRYKNDTAQKRLTRSHYCTSGCEHRIPNVTRFVSGYETGIIPQVDKDTIGTVPKKQNETISHRDPITKGCRYIGKATSGKKIQVDSHGLKGFIKVIWEYIVGPEEEAQVFICDN